MFKVVPENQEYFPCNASLPFQKRFSCPSFKIIGVGTARTLKITAGRFTFPGICGEQHPCEQITTKVTIFAKDPADVIGERTFDVTIKKLDDPPIVHGLAQSIKTYPMIWNEFVVPVSDTEEDEVLWL